MLKGWNGERDDVIGKYLLGMACCITARAGTVVADEPLDIRPGLWEITLTLHAIDVPPIPPAVLGKLTPDERARIETKAKELAADGPRASVKRSCLDQTDLQGSFMLAFGGGSQGCQPAVTNASRTGQEIRVDCGKDSGRGGGTVRVEAPDPEHVKVSSRWSASDGARILNMSSTATLKWLGAACELDRPAAPKAVAADPAAPGTPSAEASHYYKQGRELTAKNDLWGALRSFNRAIELDPGSAAAYNARGYVYLRMQSFANAMVEFSNAIRLRPDYANAYENRAIVRRRMGDEEGAAQDTRKAAALENRH